MFLQHAAALYCRACALETPLSLYATTSYTYIYIYIYIYKEKRNREATAGRGGAVDSEKRP